MTRAENFMKKGKCSKNHCSSMSNQSWTDLNSQGSILKLHDKCPNPKCGCQKIFFLLHINICLREIRLKTNYKKFSQERKKLGIALLKLHHLYGLKMATPLISAAIAGKTQNPQSAQVTNSILKSLTGGKVLSLTDMHGKGLRLKVM